MISTTNIPYQWIDEYIHHSLKLKTNKQTNKQKTKQNKTKQNKTKQNKKQNKNKTKQNKNKKNKQTKKKPLFSRLYLIEQSYNSKTSY